MTYGAADGAEDHHTGDFLRGVCRDVRELHAAADGVVDLAPVADGFLSLHPVLGSFPQLLAPGQVCAYHVGELDRCCREVDGETGQDSGELLLPRLLPSPVHGRVKLPVVAVERLGLLLRRVAVPDVEAVLVLLLVGEAFVPCELVALRRLVAFFHSFMSVQSPVPLLRQIRLELVLVAVSRQNVVGVELVHAVGNLFVGPVERVHELLVVELLVFRYEHGLFDALIRPERFNQLVRGLEVLVTHRADGV